MKHAGIKIQGGYLSPRARKGEDSIRRRGNCHDNAVTESFFQLLNRERIQKKIYETREETRSNIFDYIKMFYNIKRQHGSSEQMPPTDYENQDYQRLRNV